MAYPKEIMDKAFEILAERRSQAGTTISTGCR